jgi:hypothetical protein
VSRENDNMGATAVESHAIRVVPECVRLPCPWEARWLPSSSLRTEASDEGGWSVRSRRTDRDLVTLELLDPWVLVGTADVVRCTRLERSTDG